MQRYVAVMYIDGREVESWFQNAPDIECLKAILCVAYDVAYITCKVAPDEFFAVLTKYTHVFTRDNIRIECSIYV